MRKYRFHALALVVLASALTAAFGVGGAGAGQNAASESKAVTGKVRVLGIWTSDEQKKFLDVVAGFNKLYPKVKISYTSAGNNVPTVLATQVAGGKPPDIADIAQPALLVQYAQQHKLKPLTFMKSQVQKNFGSAGVSIGSVGGQLYGLLWKASNKSEVWYNTGAFKNAGVKPAKTWPAFIKLAKTIRGSGLPAYSIGGGEAWTLTDLFENIYLRSAGPQKYDQLSAHKIKWTDPSVIKALTYMSQVIGDTKNIAGGTSAALQSTFAQSVAAVLTPKKPKAAMVLEGDFVPSDATAGAKAIKDYNEFTFPSINGSPPTAEASGDTIIAFRDNPAVEAFMKYLTTPQSALIWIKKGGFTSPNHNVPLSAYSDPLQRAAAKGLVTAQAERFDLSDLQPIAFGGTTGQGEWKIFQDFLKSPHNVNGIAASLEKSAAAAYKKKK
jgi:alpha-glucoside transport system substrate-binding protein